MYVFVFLMVISRAWKVHTHVQSAQNELRKKNQNRRITR